MWENLLTLLPFQEQFMNYALMAILLASPIFGLLGTMVVQNKMSFFSDAIGHGAFTGIAIGTILGASFNLLNQPVLSAVIFSIVFAIAVTLVKNKTRMSTDTVIGVFSSVGIALGLFLISLMGMSYNKLGNLLVGDILSVTRGELTVMFIMLAVLIACWLMLPNKLLLIGINGTLSKSRGVKTLLIEIIFSCLVAVAVTLSVSWIGILVINSFLVLPSASARNISVNMRQYTLFSVIIALFSGVLGLVTAYFLGTAAGASVVLVNAVIFFITFIFKAIRGKKF